MGQRIERTDSGVSGGRQTRRFIESDASRRFDSRGSAIHQVDDVLVNGVSTGACAASELGGCIVWTDTGDPYTELDTSLLPPDTLEGVRGWMDAAGASDFAAGWVGPRFFGGLAPCSAFGSMPLNITLRAGGVDFTAARRNRPHR